MRFRSPRRYWLLWFAALAAAIFLAAWRLLGVQPLFAWLLAANVAAFGIWGLDKALAQRRARRVPEAVLHTMAAAGASLASLAAMSVFRHKTRRPWFRRLYVFLLIVQTALLLWHLEPWA